MAFGPIDPGQRHGILTRSVSWLAISIFLLAVAIDGHGSVRWEMGPRCGEPRALPPPATEADVREMMNRD